MKKYSNENQTLDFYDNLLQNSLNNPILCS